MADAAALPFYVDPLTYLWQSDVRPADQWVSLPYGAAAPLRPDDVDVDRLAAEVVDFQLAQGASAVIPAYPYIPNLTDGWMDVAIRLLIATGAHLDDLNVRVPVIPVACAQLTPFTHPRQWAGAAGRFANVARDIGATTVAVSLSPTGTGEDSYAKVLRLFTGLRRLGEDGLNVIAWRQGVYGLGLVAAGLSGYETGIATSEQSNVSALQAGRRPPKPKPDQEKKSSGGAWHGRFFEPFGHSLSSTVTNALLGHSQMRAKLLCDSESCCPTARAMIERPGHHAIRARARMLARIDDQPRPSWRLHTIAREAVEAVALAAQANEVLRDAGVKERLHASRFEALAQVARELQQLDAATG
jgi:hypothetical protein